MTDDPNLLVTVSQHIEKSLNNARVSKVGHDFYAPEAKAALAAIRAAGYAVVPRKPTHEMVVAGRSRPYREDGTHVDWTDRNTILTWDAMIAAAESDGDTP
jgi:hypothetical protein